MSEGKEDSVAHEEKVTENVAEKTKKDSSSEKSVKENGDASSAKSSPKKGSPRKDSNKANKETPKATENGQDDKDDNKEDNDEEDKPKNSRHWDWVKIPEDEDSEEEKDLTVTGKRVKKKVERLEVKDFLSPKEEPPFEIKEGPGVKLGDIPFFNFNLNRTMAFELQGLHYLLFFRKKIMAFKSKIKSQIRQYSGDPDGEDSTDQKKRKEYLERMTLTQVRDLLGMVGLDKKGTKPELNERFVQFLLKPFNSGKKVPGPKKKKSKSKTKKSKSKKSEKEKKEKKKKKEEKSADDKDGDDDDDDDDDGISSDSDDDAEDSPPKKKAKIEKSPKEKKKAADKKKATPKKSPKKETAKKTPKKSTPKKTTPKKTPKGKKAEDMSDLSSDSDDEPLAKIKKPSPPDNSEIKKVVKKLLEGANLEEVTMKTVVKKVYAKYPSFDLSDKKDFIKSVVREVIS